MMSSKHGRKCTSKLRLTFIVVLLQTLLTFISVSITNEEEFLAWIITASAVLGVAVPATFSMTTDLIPSRDKGYVAAMITATAYFVAGVLSTEWTFDRFRGRLLGVMVFESLSPGVVSFFKLPFIDTLAQ